MLTNFYTIDAISEQEGIFIVEVHLNPEHPVFKGHFPGNPVTPGVCMLFMVKDCASRMIHRPFHYERVDSCKFLSVINPLENPRITFALQMKEEGDLQACAYSGEKIALKLHARLAS